VQIENPVIREWFWAFDNDTAAFEALLHPDIDWFPIDENYGHLHGIDAALRNRNEWLEAWEDHEMDVEQVAADGDSAVVAVHITAQGRSSGARADLDFYVHVKVRDDKVVHLHDYDHPATALEAAGLSPGRPPGTPRSA
jgi:ketosteroid isomerase-like protein